MIYIVQEGDTLSKIANRYNVTVSNIQKANNDIKNADIINIGQRLTIPIETAMNYDNVGKQLEKCLNDIKKLDSFKILRSMME